MPADYLTDRELVVLALQRFANDIQTGSPLLAPADLKERGQLHKLRALTPDQVNRVSRLRLLVERFETMEFF